MTPNYDPQKTGLGKLNTKKRGMQSVTCLFCNVTALNIIDIVDELLRATESGHRSCIIHLVGSPVAAKLQGGTFLRKERLKQ